MKNIIIKVLKSKGWKYNKESKTWSHKNVDYVIDPTARLNAKNIENIFKFQARHQNAFYIADLKEKGRFIPTKLYQERKKKLENMYGFYY